MYYSYNLDGDECSSLRDNLNRVRFIDRESMNVGVRA
jgi:hypothetical protein